MSRYRLTYFNARSRAEPARLLFALAGVEYKDVRLKLADWKAIKQSCPFGQLPILDVDGTTLCQSHVILSYLGEQFGLAGESALERAQAAMIALCTEDMLEPLFQVYRTTSDFALKLEAAVKYSAGEKFAGFLEKFEQLLKSNNGGDGYFVGNKLSYADIVVYYWIDWLISLQVEPTINNYPKLKALLHKVKSNAKITEWEKNRLVSTL